MANLYPSFSCIDARKQAEFYARAFGGEIIMLRTFGEMPGGDPNLKDKVMHLRLQAAGQLFFLNDAVREPARPGNNITLTLDFETEAEAQNAFTGLSEGGNVVIPLAGQFWGNLTGMLVDQFGVLWQISVGL